MARVLFLIFLFVISLNKISYSQNINGLVLEENSNEPVIGAVVTVFAHKQLVKGTYTNEKGEFELKGIEAGNYTLKVQAINYKEHIQPINILEGNNQVTIRLAIGAELDPVEIIGDRRIQKKMITGTATQIDAKTIRLINPMGTQEMLKYVPGVYGASDDGMGNSRISIGIRGLSPRRSSRILIMEDGVPIEPALYLYPNMYYNPPVERIDGIEIIKGSAGIKYGPHTMGGVINYITNRPRKELGGLSQLTFGNNGYVSAFAEVGGWGNEKIHPEIQFLYKRGEGYRENNDFDQYNGTIKTNVIIDQNKTLYIKANINQETSQATYTGLTEYSFRANPRFNPKGFDEFKVFRAALDLIYTNKISSSVTSITKAYTSYFKRDWWRENNVFVRASEYNAGIFNPVPFYTTGDLIRVGNRQNNFGNIRQFYVAGLERSYTVKHKFLGLFSTLEVGGRYYWDRFIDEKLLGFSPDARNGVFYLKDTTGAITIQGQAQNFETTAFSAYFMEKINITEKFVVVPGARVELFEQTMVDRLRGSKYFDKTSFVFLPGLGANYQINQLNVFAGIHRGYTPPANSTLNILNFGQNSNGIDIKSEKSWNSELGIRGDIPWLNFEVAAFNMSIKDVIALGKGGTLKNLGTARTYGLEWNSRLKISTWSKYLPDFNVAYTLLYTELGDAMMASALKPGEVNVKGNELPYAPRHSIVAGLSKDLGKFSARVDVTYVSQVYTDYENIEFTRNRGDTGPVPAYSLFDASLLYRHNNNWVFFITGKNLLDNIYIGSRLHSDPYQSDGSNYLFLKANTSSGILPGARRQINVGIRYMFGQQTTKAFIPSEQK
ncbi:MAG: TonB-dependent receptor domain-containing protein [Cytophagaceae bacterium]